ncbi:MAG: peptidoglycan DD-metalloendopeptidase family protein, partial [Gammaproteobacteria bacterium]|nr:peptidoglycan DD-metalloendopeptidase family protein [Gammaproteobacteria bacterium]
FLAACSATAVRWNPDVHTVRRGDTVFSIAWRYGLDYRELAAWNGIGSSYLIFPGQELRLQAPSGAVSTAERRRSESEKPAPASTKAETKSVQRLVSDAVNNLLPAPRSDFEWGWPTQGKLVARFGDAGSSNSNKGVNIGGRYGQEIRAAAPGKVVYSGSGLIGYGKIIIIKHTEQFLSAYGHNKELLVKEGDQVRGGERIALMGRGPNENPVLHFEIRYNGRAVNPINYLPKR